MARAPLLLFALSGSCAMVYQVVWARRLELVFGVTLPAVSTVLAGFMGGLALGSLWGGRLARTTRRPLRLYGLLELGVAVAAALVPPMTAQVLAFIERTDLPVAPARFLLTIAVLLPATTLMGATFPVLCRALPRGESGRSVAGLYAANLAGATAGVLASAYLLFAFLGLARTHAAAVGLNLAVGAAAWRLGRDGRSGAADAPRAAAAGAAAVAAVFVSGACGMAAEVVWTRLLVPSFNNSSYGFASVLTIFLLGLGAGSALAGRARASGEAALGAVQVLAGVLCVLGYLSFEVTQLLQIRLGADPLSGVRPAILGPLLEAAIVLTPLAAAQGAVFPLAVRTLGGGSLSDAVARLYSWNTLGAILGALAAGFWLVPALGVQGAVLAVAAASMACGAALVARGRPGPAALAVPALCAAVLGAAWLQLRGRSLPAELLVSWMSRAGVAAPALVSYRDDAQASVAVVSSGGTRSLVINGMGVTGYTDATKLLAHVPLLLHPRPERALVICFGMGTTFRSALSHAGRVDAVELVPAVLAAFPSFFPDAARLAADPRARLIVNDGRNHLLREREGYDVIMLDPSPPLYAAGTANLYNKDFFALARRRLKAGGLLAVWLPAYPESEFKMILRSFAEALPFTQVWRAGKGNDLGAILIGGEAAPARDRARVRAALRRPGIRRDLGEFGGRYDEEGAFWSLYRGEGSRYRGYLADARQVTDDEPWIEYPYFRALRPEYLRLPSMLKD